MTVFFKLSSTGFLLVDALFRMPVLLWSRFTGVPAWFNNQSRTCLVCLSLSGRHIFVSFFLLPSPSFSLNCAFLASLFRLLSPGCSVLTAFSRAPLKWLLSPGYISGFSFLASLSWLFSPGFSLLISWSLFPGFFHTAAISGLIWSPSFLASLTLLLFLTFLFLFSLSFFFLGDLSGLLSLGLDFCPLLIAFPPSFSAWLLLLAAPHGFSLGASPSGLLSLVSLLVAFLSLFSVPPFLPIEDLSYLSQLSLLAFLY